MQRPLLGVAVLIVGLVAVSPSEATFPGRNGRLAIAGDFGGSNVTAWGVLSFRPDGSGFRDLYSSETERETGADFAFSPSGRKGVLTREGERPGVYLMRADGRGRRRLVARPGRGWRDTHPDWSPSERAVVFERSRPGSDPSPPGQDRAGRGSI